jgi:hypothetical protein
VFEETIEFPVTLRKFGRSRHNPGLKRSVSIDAVVSDMASASSLAYVRVCRITMIFGRCTLLVRSTCGRGEPGDTTQNFDECPHARTTQKWLLSASRPENGYCSIIGVASSTKRRSTAQRALIMPASRRLLFAPTPRRPGRPARDSHWDGNARSRPTS